MDFIPDNKYLGIALFLTLIFGNASPNPESKRLENDTDTRKNVHSRTVQSNITTLPDTKNTSTLPENEPSNSRVVLEPGGKSPSAARNCVIVFDIDDTICVQSEPGRHRQLWFRKRKYPECPQIEYTHQKTDGERVVHTFLPHLRILFNYLLERGARIVFFSEGTAERNLSVISELLKIFYGIEKYEALKSKGQFAIYSDGDLKCRSAKDESLAKDLRVVKRDGESLSDIILVDEGAVRAGFYDQQPFIFVRDLCTANGGDVVLNSVYYMLGLFRTYFENEEYSKLPIREAMVQILPKNHPSRCTCRGPFINKFVHEPIFSHDLNCEEHPFVRDMIDKGLAAVQEQLPTASLYQRQNNFNAPLNRTKLI